MNKWIMLKIRIEICGHWITLIYGIFRRSIKLFYESQLEFNYVIRVRLNSTHNSKLIHQKRVFTTIIIIIHLKY